MGTQAKRRGFLQLFQILPTFLEIPQQEKNEKQLAYFDHQNLNSLCVTISARASFVFLWSYRTQF